jgi:hypothetical protein
LLPGRGYWYKRACRDAVGDVMWMNASERNESDSVSRVSGVDAAWDGTEKNGFSLL